MAKSVKKPKLTRAAVEPLIDQTFGNYAGIAMVLKVSRQSVHEFIGKDAGLLAMMEAEKERVIDIVERSLYKQAADGRPWAVCFFLKTQAKHRGYVERSQDLPPLDLLLAALPDHVRAVVQDALAKSLQPGGHRGGSGTGPA